jgi:hypothetical protein
MCPPVGFLYYFRNAEYRTTGSEASDQQPEARIDPWSAALQSKGDPSFTDWSRKQMINFFDGTLLFLRRRVIQRAAHIPRKTAATLLRRFCELIGICILF